MGSLLGWFRLLLCCLLNSRTRVILCRSFLSIRCIGYLGNLCIDWGIFGRNRNFRDITAWLVSQYNNEDVETPTDRFSASVSHRSYRESRLLILVLYHGRIRIPCDLYLFGHP